MQNGYEIRKIMAYLIDMEKLGANYIDLQCSYDHGGEYEEVFMQPLLIREEYQQEIDERESMAKKEEKRLADLAEWKELDEYRRLKLKYEPNIK